jgi:hypothetical protein
MVVVVGVVVGVVVVVVEGVVVDRRPQWTYVGIGQCSRSGICRVEAALAQVVLGDAFGDGRVELVKLLQKLLHLLEDEERGVGKGAEGQEASVRLHSSPRSSSSPEGCSDRGIMPGILTGQARSIVCTRYAIRDAGEGERGGQGNGKVKEWLQREQSKFLLC